MPGTGTTFRVICALPSMMAAIEPVPGPDGVVTALGYAMEDVLLPKNAVQVVRGASKTLQLTVTGADLKPLDLTGARVVMTVKNRIEDTHNVFQKTSDDEAQIKVTSLKGGLAQIFINPGDTQGRDIKQYVFDVWVVLPDGKRYAVVPPSVFDLQPGVTTLA